MKILIALGGNALVLPGQKGSVEEQFENVDKALNDVVTLAAEGHKIVLTHGNGFQVGNIILRSQLASGQSYELPLYVADAQTQGEIGFIIQRSLQNKFYFWQAGIMRQVVTILTQVLVDKNDPAFRSPTKPIGRYYTFEEMKSLRKTHEFWKEDCGRGWRRLVPSPKPLEIIEKDIIKELFERDVLVIACGGGGIPVVQEGKALKGVEAVIDKDLASSVLAVELGVERFVILTGVKCVALDFGKPSQLWLEKLTLTEAKRYLAEGHFPEGSMGPKILSAISFLEKSPSGEVIITSLDNLYAALYARGGTRICIS